MKFVFADLVSSIICDKDLTLEIDKECSFFYVFPYYCRKLQKVPDVSETQYWDDATIDEAVMRHQQMLETLTMTFLYRMSDADIIEKMPRPIRF